MVVMRNIEGVMRNIKGVHMNKCWHMMHCMYNVGRLSNNIPAMQTGNGVTGDKIIISMCNG